MPVDLDWDFCQKPKCRNQRVMADLRDPVYCRQWLRGLKGDARAVFAMREVVFQGGRSQDLFRMRDDEIVEHVAELLVSGLVHVHPRAHTPEISDIDPVQKTAGPLEQEPPAWEFCSGVNCGVRPEVTGLRDRYFARRWLMLLKEDAVGLLALRTFLSQRGKSAGLSRMQDHDMIEHAAELLLSGRMHVHPLKVLPIEPFGASAGSSEQEAQEAQAPPVERAPAAREPGPAPAPAPVPVAPKPAPAAPPSRPRPSSLPSSRPSPSPSSGPSAGGRPSAQASSSGANPSSQPSSGSKFQSSAGASSQSSGGSSSQSSIGSSSQPSSASSSQSRGRSSSSSKNSRSSTSSRSSSSSGATASLWVRLDLTQEEAAAEAGKLRLQGATGGYNQTIAIAGNFIANPAPDNTVDVHFSSVPTSDSYSLTYIAADGTETTVVQSAAFHTLNDNSLPEEPAGSPATPS